MRDSAVTLAYILAAAVVTRTARANDAWTVTREEGAETCPSTAELRARIVERLGRDPFTGDAPLTLSVEFARTGETFTATIRSNSGERQLRSDAPTCGSLADSVALAASLLARDAERPTPPPPAPPTPPEPLPRESERPPFDVPPRSAVFAGASLLVGVLPRVAPAPTLSIRARFASHLLASGAVFYAPQQRTPDGALGFSLAAVQAGPETASDAESPEGGAAAAQARRRLEAVLDDMDLEKRAVFVMFEIDEMPYEDIAEALGIPVGTVHSRLHAARIAFTKALARHNAKDARRFR